MSDLKTFLEKKVSRLQGIDVFFEENMERYSTMRIASRANLIVVYSTQALQKLLPLFSQEGVNYKLLGWGANQLIRHNPNFVYLKLKFPFEKSYLDEVRDEYTLPASVSLSNLTSHAVKFGLSGWEVFTGVPASLGGAIRMNAGTNLGEIGELVREVKIVTKNGEIKTHSVDNTSFSYRDSHFVSEGDVIVSATLTHKGVSEEVKEKIREYLKLRNATQPLKEKTCGCMLKNDTAGGKACRAGQSIDILGLKGFILNDAQISHKHANFMVNRGEASYNEVLECLSIVRDELYLQMGIKFEVEFEI